MEPFDFNDLFYKLERITQQLSQMRFDAYLQHVNNWKRRLYSEFLNGIARGLGFSVGFSILGALVLCILHNVTLSNLPVIGKFLADLVRIIENNLS